MNALYEWYQAAEQLRALKEREMALRKQVFGEFFPAPVEGTNKCAIEGNAVLVATLPYNYALDEDAINVGLALVPESKRDTLIKWKPSLAKAVYNTLSKKAKTAFTAECLTITPGTPSLVIKPAE